MILVALACVSALAGTSALPAGAPDPTSLDLGSIDPADPYFPGLGNAGYDVRHYDLALRADAGQTHLDAVATITARATTALKRFNLDLVGLDVHRVEVDGKKARFTRDGRELRIRPAQRLRRGATFRIEVDYGGTATTGEVPGLGLTNGWITANGATFTLGEPDAASRWYPANDHPRDKASFTFRLEVPNGTVAVANGRLQSQATTGDTTTWVWKETKPMATYLAQVGIGDFVLDEQPGPNGITIRNAIARSLQDETKGSAVTQTTEMVTYFSSLFGPFPFDVYGVVVPDAELAYAFEGQTLTLIGRNRLLDPTLGATVLAHELAHQWFGDWVSPSNWRDIWLNEGFATYGEWLWADHALGVPLADSAERARRAVAGDDSGRRTDDPGVDHMFGVNSYQRGALTLHALRAEVGEETFFRILGIFLDRFGGRTATTKNFIDTAQDVSGQNLRSFFDTWLGTGPLPGSS